MDHVTPTEYAVENFYETRTGTRQWFWWTSRNYCIGDLYVQVTLIKLAQEVQTPEYHARQWLNCVDLSINRFKPIPLNNSKKKKPPAWCREPPTEMMCSEKMY